MEGDSEEQKWRLAKRQGLFDSLWVEISVVNLNGRRDFTELSFKDMAALSLPLLLSVGGMLPYSTPSPNSHLSPVQPIAH